MITLIRNEGTHVADSGVMEKGRLSLEVVPCEALILQRVETVGQDMRGCEEIGVWEGQEDKGGL